MTVYKPIGRLGVRAAEVAVKMGQNARKTDKTDIPPPDILMDNQSGSMTPAYLEKVIAIGKDNIDIVIRDGFHSQEDVFRNVAVLSEGHVFVQ